MANWYARRLGQALFTIFVVVNFTFGLIRLLPGGPMDYLRAQLAQNTASGTATQTNEQLNALIQTYTNIQPDKPLWQQWLDYVFATVQGDLGQSLWYQKPVSLVLAESLPWTLFIMSISILLTFAIGISLGAAMAYWESSHFDSVTTLGGMFANSIPYYVVALLLVWQLGYQKGWFPTGGRIPSGVEAGLNLPFITGALYHAAMPIVSFVVTSFGLVAVSMRGNSVRILGEDYLRVARLRGLPDNRIISRYVVRNAVLPMYTGLLISIGFMFGGSVVLEQIFNYRGAGYYIFQAISTRDYTLMMGGFLVITTTVVIALFIADMTYGILDPRVAAGSEEHEY
jgi:peptide/nickel transport system permease protein